MWVKAMTHNVYANSLVESGRDQLGTSWIGILSVSWPLRSLVFANKTDFKA